MNNNNRNMKNHTRKRSRNWNNNVSSAKRARLNKKGVSFKNSNNIKNLNMSNNMKESRKSIVTDKLTRNSENIEHLLERLRKQTPKNHRKKILKNLKNQNKLFKE
jgi:hypothetical protein